MLRLINVCKSYKYGKNKVLVLDNINIDFKKKELVFILGKSGSGKSTLLNIIGGLLEVDSGNVMLDNRDITKFNNNMLCNYRNNMIGFIFQDYHLIEYMNVIDNIKLGMTINDNNNDRIDDVLRKLGIYSKRKVKVNKLSGGEKQRVAIARSIINESDIILCDEPTGALDQSNSRKIMNILKDLSKDKLVIVVSHDNLLANNYADRIINIDDGKVKYEPQVDNCVFRDISKKKIKLVQIIKLAIKNLGLKKGRTFFTSLAISIGFISMLFVLCLSKSFSDDINKLERDVVSLFPVSIYNGEYEKRNKNIISDDSKIINKKKEEYVHTNMIDNNYLDYINDMDNIKYIRYKYDISMPLVSDRYKLLDNVFMNILPSNEFIDDNYDILYGNNISGINEIILKVDSNNNVSSELLNVFDIDDDIDYIDLIGRKIRIVLNNLYYKKIGNYYFIDNDMEKLFKHSDIELEIVGIVRENEIIDDNNYFYCDRDLINYVIDRNSNSEIVLEQINNDYNVLGLDISKNEMLSYLGYNTLPNGIDIYVSNLDNKKILLEKLDDYNKKHRELIYIDTMNNTIDIVKNIINIITLILVLFCLISVLVISLMIFILTNNRVMERIKEIGVLRSLGARNKDIIRLFNIENLIMGIISSVIGMGFLIIIKNPVNSLMGIILDDNGLFKIDSYLVIISIIFNIFIVVLSGYIPTKMASKKKIIDCVYGRV